MPHTLKNLEKSQVELTITVPPADYQKDLEEAAVRISERASIPGFRPGKAPYKIVKEQLGEIKIFEEALESIVQKNFFTAIQAEKLETVGQPQITIEKIAPGNDFVFRAVVALLPSVKLPDLSKIKVERRETKVEEKDVDHILEDLKKMRPEEKIKAGISTTEDKMIIDLEMFSGNVPLEGGQAKDHQVYLSEKHYIPGLAEQLVGLKKDDKKDFTLKFPAEHYQKQFAGKDIDFKVLVKDVFELHYPEIDDAFAKKLGQESVAKLRELLRQNISAEANAKEEQRLEIEMLDQIVAQSEFSELPEIIIKAEKEKMFHELKHELEHQGITMEKYLSDIKKSEEEIHLDFSERADKRVKAALISRQIAKDRGITVENKEMEEEFKLIKASYGDDKNVEENLKRPEVRATIALALQNKKVIQWLKEQIIK